MPSAETIAQRRMVRAEPRPVVALDQAVVAVVDRALAEAERARVELELRAAPRVEIERTRLERVVLNLVRHALRQSPGAPVALRVDEDADAAVVVVVDQGPDCAASELETVFDWSPRTADGLPREDVRLGLHISRLIVEDNHGAIGARRAPGGGTAYWVRLPLARPATVPPSWAPPPTATIGDAESGALVGVHLLVVDDAPTQAAGLATLLREEGARVDLAFDGRQAMVRLAGPRPDLVIVDPDLLLSGVGLLARLRALHPDLPVMLVSALPIDHPTTVAYLAAPRVGFAPKPIEFGPLLAQVNQLLQRG